MLQYIRIRTNKSERKVFYLLRSIRINGSLLRCEKMRDYKFADALVIGNDIYTVGSPTKCWCHYQIYSQFRISESLSEYEKNQTIHM